MNISSLEYLVCHPAVVQTLFDDVLGLYYINAYGHEAHPSRNPDYLSGLSSYDILVYSCGSLWTSI